MSSVEKDRIDRALEVRPGSTPRLYQTIAQKIAAMIQAHAHMADWRIPSERELADQLGVSRPVIREAIIALEMLGLVEVRGRTGIVVLEQPAKPISFDTFNVDIGPGPFELLEARLAIEASAAAMAAESATTADHAILEACIEQMQLEHEVVLLNEKGDRDFRCEGATRLPNACAKYCPRAASDHSCSPAASRSRRHRTPRQAALAAVQTAPARYRC